MYIFVLIICSMDKYKLLLLLVLLPLISFSQKGFLAGGAVHYGFIMEHRPTMAHLLKAHTKGFELDFAKQTSGKKSWHQVFLFPETGMKFYFSDLGNPQELGVAAGIIPYIYLPFSRTDNFSFGINLGTGYGYVSKIFNTENNHKNLVISTHINGILHGMLETKIKLTRQLSMRAAVALTHFSNGAVKVPNLGINITTAAFGFNYYFDKIRANYHHDSLPAISHKLEFSLSAAGGVKEIYPVGGKKFTTWTAIGTVLQPVKRKSKIGFGVDVFYNTALKVQLSDSAGNAPTSLKIMRLGLGIPYEIRISKINFSLEAGFYLINPKVSDGSAYQRIGFKYYFNNHLFFTNMLKVHFGKADNIEFGLGYTF